jgi:hypothetical protein
MADNDDFYVEDESIEQVRAAIKRSEKGETVGKRDLNQRARGIVDRAVARLESDPVRVQLTVISGTGMAPPEEIDASISDGQSLVERTDITVPLEYRVG